MASVFDVATFILRSNGPMTTAKLQKLVYYAQAWNLAWYGRPLFDGDFEAWKNGPVCRPLFNAHKGQRTVATHRPAEYRETLSDEACALLYSVLEKYGDKDGDALSNQSHTEAPWIHARGALGADDHGNECIEPARIIEYFVTLEKEQPSEAPTKPEADAVRRARFRRSKENVLRTHAELFEQLAK